MVLVNSVLQTCRISPKIFHNFVTPSQKLSPVPSKAEKDLKNIGFRGRKDISLLGAPNY
jgi:hypothetical protein